MNRRFRILLHCLLCLTAVIIFRQIALTTRRTAFKKSAQLVDYKLQPLCLTKRQEFVRFSELLANPLCKCKTFGATSPRDLCRSQLWAVPNLTFVTILNSDGDLKFERSLVEKSERHFFGTVIFIDSNNVDAVSSLDIDRRHFSKFHLQPTENDPPTLVESILDIVVDQHAGKIDYLSIDVDSLSRKPEVQIEILKLLFLASNKLAFDQLYLILNVKSNYRQQIIYGWYSLISQLYFLENTAFYSATQQGSCDFEAANSKDQQTYVENSCTFRIQFRKIDARIDDITDLSVPIAGMGSPAEEYERLKHVITTSADLQDVQSKESCQLFGFVTSLQQSDTFSNYSACEAKLYEPRWLDKENKVVWHDSNNQSWNLSSIFRQPDVSSHSVILFTDLLGFEFDLLIDLSSAVPVETFSKIFVKMYLWLGEEHANYRLIYRQFVRMEKIGFSRHFLGYCDKRSSEYTYFVTNVCYRVAWVRE